jgi:hypothetical protein
VLPHSLEVSSVLIGNSFIRNDATPLDGLIEECFSAPSITMTKSVAPILGVVHDGISNA